MTVTQYGYHEKLVNGYAEGDLDGAISDVATSLDVLDAAGLPSAGFFRLKINNEIMVCSGRSGNTVNIMERGAEGTVAAAHSNGDLVDCVITNEALQRYLLSNNHHSAAYTQDTTFDDSHAWPIPLGRSTDQNATITASSFTWQNQGAATITDSAGGFKMTIPKETGFKLRGVTLTPPTPPYAFSARFRWMVAPDSPVGNTTSFFGIWIRDTAGKLITLAERSANNLAMWRWNSWTSYNGQIDTAWAPLDPQSVWLRFEDDGTDIKGYASIDGSNWSHDGPLWFQDGRTNFLTAGGNGIGFFMSSTSTGGGAGNSGAGPAEGMLSIESFHVEDK